MADSAFLINPAPLVEPLTRRERRILARLAGDLYNREIAEALTLSPNSIKWYTRQIYAKLGVNSRKAAIQRARELGLLETKTSPVFHAAYPPGCPDALRGPAGRAGAGAPVAGRPGLPPADPDGCRRGGQDPPGLAGWPSELQGNYPQGAWLVELASLSDPELVPQTVAAAFDLRPERDRPILNGLGGFSSQPELAAGAG